MAARSTQAHAARDGSEPKNSSYINHVLSLVQGRAGRQAPETQLLTITFDVHPDHASALKSALDDFTSIIGTRMESRYDYEVEDALVRASIAIARMRAAVNAVVPRGEPKFPTRKGRT